MVSRKHDIAYITEVNNITYYFSTKEVEGGKFQVNISKDLKKSKESKFLISLTKLYKNNVEALKIIDTLHEELLSVGFLDLEDLLRRFSKL